METNEIRNKIVKLMEQRDRAWLDSKSPEEAEEIADNCNIEIRALYSLLESQRQPMMDYAQLVFQSEIDNGIIV